MTNEEQIKQSDKAILILAKQVAKLETELADTKKSSEQYRRWWMMANDELKALKPEVREVIA